MLAARLLQSHAVQAQRRPPSPHPEGALPRPELAGIRGWAEAARRRDNLGGHQDVWGARDAERRSTISSPGDASLEANQTSLLPFVVAGTPDILMLAFMAFERSLGADPPVEVEPT